MKFKDHPFWPTIPRRYPWMTKWQKCRLFARECVAGQFETWREHQWPGGLEAIGRTIGPRTVTSVGLSHLYRWYEDKRLMAMVSKIAERRWRLLRALNGNQTTDPDSSTG